MGASARPRVPAGGRGRARRGGRRRGGGNTSVIVVIFPHPFALGDRREHAPVVVGGGGGRRGSGCPIGNGAFPFWGRGSVRARPQAQTQTALGRASRRRTQPRRAQEHRAAPRGVASCPGRRVEPTQVVGWEVERARRSSRGHRGGNRDTLAQRLRRGRLSFGTWLEEVSWVATRIGAGTSTDVYQPRW